jgi:branched-chain amino acid transport system ATP-binding protein
MSVYDNLFLGGYTKPDTIGQMIEEVFELFPRLKERSHQQAKTMSGGERQMLCIGRALMSSPKLILFDEPSLGLQPSIVLQIFDIIKKIHEKGVAILLVEQNVYHTLTITDRTYVLEHGRIALEGRSDVLIGDDYIKTSYLAI